jgi:hypothetical protein
LGPLIAKKKKRHYCLWNNSPFIEYLIDSRRAQAEKVYQMEGSEIDSYMRDITDLCENS